MAAMCVDDATGSSAAGNPVQFSTCENTGEQNWTVQPDGTIQVNGVCLDTSGGGTAAGTPAVVNPCNSASTQVWTQGPGDALVNQASGLCLAHPNASVANGTQLGILSCDGGAEQSWPLPAAPGRRLRALAIGTLSSVLVESDTGVPCVADVNNAAELLTCDGDASQNVTMERTDDPGQRRVPGHGRRRDHRGNPARAGPLHWRQHSGLRVLVALTDPAQQLNVVAGIVAAGGEGRRADVPVRIVHV